MVVIAEEMKSVEIKISEFKYKTKSISSKAIIENGDLKVYADDDLILKMPFEYLYDMIVKASNELSNCKDKSSWPIGRDRRIEAILKGHIEVTSKLKASLE